MSDLCPHREFNLLLNYAVIRHLTRHRLLRQFLPISIQAHPIHLFFFICCLLAVFGRGHEVVAAWLLAYAFMVECQLGCILQLGVILDHIDEYIGDAPVNQQYGCNQECANQHVQVGDLVVQNRIELTASHQQQNTQAIEGNEAKRKEDPAGPHLLKNNEPYHIVNKSTGEPDVSRHILMHFNVQRQPHDKQGIRYQQHDQSDNPTVALPHFLQIEPIFVVKVNKGHKKAQEQKEDEEERVGLAGCSQLGILKDDDTNVDKDRN